MTIVRHDGKSSRCWKVAVVAERDGGASDWCNGFTVMHGRQVEETAAARTSCTYLPTRNRTDTFVNKIEIHTP